MLNIDELPQSEDYVEQPETMAVNNVENNKQENDTTFSEFVGDAFKATFPFQYEVQYPVNSIEVDQGFRQEYLETVYPTLSVPDQEALDNYGIRNPQQVEAILSRQREDAEVQQRLYDYGGIVGSIGIQGAMSLVNPADLAIAVGTLGAGKVVTSLKTIQKVTDNYRKTSAIGIGALEGGVAGYASESFRQYSSGISDEDGRFNTFLFGSVLGGSVGASGWFQHLNSMHPKEQSSLLGAIDSDTDMFTNTVNTVNTNIYNQSVGSAGYSGVVSNIDIDDIAATPKPFFSQASKWVSPRAWLYSSGLPSIYNTVKKLAPSVEALEDANGNVIVQDKKSAFDIKATYDGKLGTLETKMTKVYNEMNQQRELAGQKKLSETEFSQEMYNIRLNTTMRYRQHKAEIDVLESIETKTPEQQTRLEQLKTTEPETIFNTPQEKELNDAFDEYYGYMEDKLRRPKIDKEIEEINLKLEDMEIDAKGRDKLEARLDTLNKWEPSEYKGYLTRVFDKDKIQARPDVVKILTRALQNSPTARAMGQYLSKEDFALEMNKLSDIANNMANKIENARDLNELRDLVGSSSKSGAGNGIASGGFSTGRRIDIDESLVEDLVQKDMSEILNFYHTDMSGKLSIREAFQDSDINTWEDFRTKAFPTLPEEYRVAGKSRGDIDRTNAALQLVFNDIRGTQGIMSRPNSWGQTAKKVVTSLNNIRFGPNFPVVALNELGPTLHMGGIKSLSYFGKSMSSAIKKIRNKEVGVEFINELIGMGIGNSIQQSKAMLRYTEGNHFFESNRVVNALRKAEHAVFRYGGLVAMTDAMKSALAGGFTGRITNIANRVANGGKLSTTENRMLSRIGVTKDDLFNIDTQLKTHAEYEADGTLKAFNIDDWDEDIADMWSMVLHRVTKGNILEPTAMDIPMLMSDPDKPFNQILTQYYKFPMAAQSTLLSKAINDKDVGALGAMMISSTTTALVEYGKVMVTAKLAELGGFEYENPYDDLLNDEDQMKLLASKSFGQNPYFGVLTSLYNIATPALQTPILGTEYVPSNIFGGLAGPTGGTIDSMVRAIAEPERMPYAIYQLAPRIPFLYDLPKHFIKDEL